MFRTMRSVLGIGGKKATNQQAGKFFRNTRIKLEALEDRTAPAVAIAYVNQAWGSLTPGASIADADPSLAGDQPAIFGDNAFANLPGGLNALSAGGTVNLSPGTYPDNATLNVASTLNVLPGTATISGSLSGASGLTKGGDGTLVLSGVNSYLGDTNVNRGLLQVSNDNQLGGALAFVNVTSPAALEVTQDMSSSRKFFLNNNATLQVDSGKTLSLSGAEINGGIVSGPGTIATTGLTATDFNGARSTSSLTLDANGNTQFSTFDNSGTLNLAATKTFGLSSFTNAPSGKIFVDGTANVTDFVTNGQITVASTGKILNVGTAGLTFGTGSLTTVNRTTTANGLINLGGSDALLAGGTMINNGLVGSSVPGVDLITNFGGLAKGSGTYSSVLTQNGGLYSAGNSPGQAGAVHFGVNGGGGGFVFEISNATGTEGPLSTNASGWSTVFAANEFPPGTPVVPTLDFTATPADKFAIDLITRQDVSPWNTLGQMSNFNPNVNNEWRFYNGTRTKEGAPVNNLVVTGTFNPAAFQINSTPNFINPINGTFSVEFRDTAAPAGPDSLYLVYTTLSGVNQPPVASNGTLNTPEDTAKTGTLVATDPDSPTLTYTVVTPPPAAEGTVAITGSTSGAYSFTPAPNFNGTTSFTFRANDGTLNSNTATISITVTPVNDAPVGANDALTAIAEDSGVRTINFTTLTGNDSKGGGTEENVQTLTITAVSAPVGGTVSISGTDVLFTPALDFVGPASFAYTVQDNGQSGSPLASDPKTGTATVNFTVTPVNDAPVGANDALSSIAEDSGVRTINFATLTGNDSKGGGTDESGQALTITAVSAPVGGTVSISGTDVLFTPTANYNGPASFTYTVQDNGQSGSPLANDFKTGTASVSFTITAVNDAPVASPGSLNVATGQTTTGTLVASDVDNASLTYSIASNPGQGTVAITNSASGAYSYTPPAGFNGTTTFTFQASDGSLTSTAATITVTVNPPTNNLRTQHRNVFDVNPGGTFDFTISNATGTEGQLSGWTRVIVDATTFPTPPPTLNFTATSAAKFTINLFTVLDSGTTPDAPGQMSHFDNSLNYSWPFVRADNAAVTVTGTFDPNAFNFVTGANFFNPINGNFKVEFRDTNGNSAPDTLFLVYTPNGIPPVASNGTLNAVEDTPTTGTLVASDADTPVNTLTYSIVGQPPAGQGTVAITGSPAAGSYSFTPGPNFNGSTSFTFQANDGSANSNTATIAVTVAPVNDAPAGTDGSVTTTEDATYTFTTANFGFTDSNDTPANALLAVKITTLPGAGTLTLNSVAVTAGQTVQATDISGGLLKFTPVANASGAPYTTFTFQVQDNGGAANGGVDLDASANTMTVNVTAVNDAPAGTSGSVATNEDTTYTFTTANFGFTDPTDTPANALLAVKITTLPTAGTLTLNSVAVTAGQTVLATDITGGLLKFAPVANANGAPYATFTFQVQDDGGVANGAVDLDASPNTMTINVTAVNDAPAGTNGTATTNQDIPYTFATADFGFTDPNDTPANALSAVTITTLPTAGTLTLNNVAVTAGQSVSAANISGNLLKFTPVTSAIGSPYATFTFQVQDNGGVANGGVDLDASPNTMTINVILINHAPAGTNGTVTTPEDTPYTFGTTDFGFTDPNDTPPNTLLAVRITTLPGTGTLTLNSVAVTAGQTVSAANITSGLLKFAPLANASGAPYTNFTFQVQDNGGTGAGGVDLDASANTLTINVTAVNDPPVAQNGSLTTQRNITATGNAVATDIDSASLTYTIVTAPPATEGTVTINSSTGAYSFTPFTNFTGSTSFIFRANDGASNSNDATISITVLAGIAPTAQSASRTTPEDTLITGILVATDPDSANLIYSIVNPPPANQGSVTITNSSTGAYSFTPALNFNGVTSFTFKANDGSFDSNTATITITITPVNDAPVAGSSSVNTTVNTPVSGTLPAIDFEGSPLFYSIVAAPSAAQGTATITDTATGAFTFTPAAGFIGTASFTFKVNDGSLDSNVATQSIVVSGANNAPVAQNASRTVAINSTVTGTLVATDADSNPLTYTLVGIPPASQGTVTITNAATGAYSFTAANAFIGSTSFTFKANDGTVDSNTATVSITVSAAGNTAPVAFQSARTTTEDTAITGTLIATDADGNTLTYSIVNPPNVTQGTVAITNATTGAFSFTPAPNFFGSTTFTFKANDGVLDSNTAAIFITVSPVNDAPVAVDGALTTPRNVAANGTLVATDVDSPSLNYSLVTLPLATQGTVLITNATTGAYTFTPATNFSGSASFTFKANDGVADSNVATISITVTSANNTAPVASNGTLNTAEDTPTTGTLVATDAEGGTLTYSIVAAPTAAQGTVLITNTATGAYSFTPAANFNGSASFTFKANDGAFDSNTATIAITVTPVNDVPVAQVGTLTTAEDTPATGTLVATDVDNTTLTYSIVTPPTAAQGTVLITNAATGAYSFTPAPNFNGSATFTFKANDGSADSNTATISIVVTAVNDAPVASIGTLIATEDTPATGTLVATDVDSATLTYSIVAPPTAAQGTVLITNAATGAYSFTPAPNFVGPASFTFKANDGAADSNTATISIVVSAVNDAPVASNGSLTTTINTPTTGTLVATDVDSASLTYSIVSPPTAAQGTVSITNSATGAFSFTPALNFTGSTSFTFKANDGGLDSNTATVSITVNASGTAATATTIVSSLNPSVYGQTVTFTATIANTSNTGTPTGSVTFLVDGVATATGIPVSGSGNTATATFVISTLTAGTHAIAANYIPTGTFVASQGSVNQTVTPKALTVTGITAADKAYDGTTFASLDLSFPQLVGVIAPDSVTLNTSGAIADFNNPNVGTAKPVTISGLTLSGPAAGNYTLAQPTATADITPLTLTVTGITASDKEYDGTTVASLDLSFPVLVGVAPGDTVTLNTSGAVGTFDTPNVGINKTVTITGLTVSNPNYILAPLTTTANITAKALTVTGITANNKVYDGTTAATINTAGATLVGLSPSDVVTLNTAGAVGTFADKNVGVGKIVTISGLTLSNPNYTLTQPTTTADITPKALTVTGITANNKVFDGTTTTTINTAGATLVGVIAPDVVTLNAAAAVGTFADRNVGNGKTVTITGLTVNNSNYTVTQPTTTTANITPKALTVTGITANNKVYDGTTAATLNTAGAVLVGVVSPDVVTLNTAGAVGTFDTPNAGTNKTVTISGLTVTNNPNYTVTQPTTTANITPAVTQVALVATPLATTGGTSITFTATVTVIPNAIGTVTFKDNGVPIPGGANISLVGGVATFSTNSLGVGSHAVTAEFNGSANFAPSTSNSQIVQVVAALPSVVSVTPNSNIPVLAGPQRSRVVSLVVVFNQAVQLDLNAITLALHTKGVSFNGVAQPAGFGSLPSNVVVSTSDNVTWIVTFTGNTDVGADGFSSLKDGVYDLNINATKVHPSGVPLLGMAANSTTTFHRLFGDIDLPTAVSVPTGTEFTARVISNDNLAMVTTFNRPLLYNAALDFNGSGTISSFDNLQFRTRFNRPLVWIV